MSQFNDYQLPITISPEQVAAFCQQNHIRRMSLFGSVLRDDFTPESDVDVLVEFEPEHVPGLIRLITMQDNFADMIGRTVDMMTPGFIHKSIRQRIMNEALVLYDAA
jgi:predicted nucleotidyltransferase